MAKLWYPPSIDWELTDNCNHKCIHCYNYWRQGEFDKVSYDKEHYIEVAQKIIENNPVSVQITGGEPFLVWENAKPAIDLMIKNNIIVSFNTNATLVNRDAALFVGKHKLDVFVSFPCFKPEIFDELVMHKGAFEKASRGIHLLIDNGARVSLNMVVTKKNLPYVYDTGRYVYDEFGAEYFSATKASFPMGACSDFRNQILSKEEFQLMLSALMRLKEDYAMRVDSAWVYSLCGFDDEVREQFGFNRKCTCGKYTFVVDAAGNMKACGCDSDLYGNILSSSFKDAISKMGKWQTGELIPVNCRTCKWLMYCGGGCRADALSSSGTTCAFDSTARPEKAVNKLIKNSDINENIIKKKYMLRPEAQFLFENGMVRLSYKTNYEYLTENFVEYLKQYSVFDIQHLTLCAGSDEKKVAGIVAKMLRKGFICESDKKVSTVKWEKGEFDIVKSPYCEIGNEEWQNKYAGFEYSCKQFM